MIPSRDKHLHVADAARRVAQSNGINTIGWIVYEQTRVFRGDKQIVGPPRRGYSLIGGVSENFHPEDH